jgi:NADH:ubiquinone oxidoreductase subunit F (NADH-binding)
VLEVEYGTPITDVVGTPCPVLLGGYHGTWATPEQVASLRFSRQELSHAGLTLGAGVVLPLAPGQCPVERTEQILVYLASQSARRCGPCLNGLPALAAAFSGAVRGTQSTGRVRELCGLVDRRGACAHPDGTVRLVRSLLVGFEAEVDAHAARTCNYREGS